MMKARLFILACLLVAVLVAVGCAPTKTTAEEVPKAEVPPGYEHIRLVGTSLGSTGSSSVMAFASVFNKYYPEIEWSSSSGTPAVNVIYLTKGDIKIGFGMPGHYIAAYGSDKIAESRIRSIIEPYSRAAYVFLIPEDSSWCGQVLSREGVSQVGDEMSDAEMGRQVCWPADS